MEYMAMRTATVLAVLGTMQTVLSKTVSISEPPIVLKEMDFNAPSLASIYSVSPQLATGLFLERETRRVIHPLNLGFGKRSRPMSLHLGFGKRQLVARVPSTAIVVEPGSVSNAEKRINGVNSWLFRNPSVLSGRNVVLVTDTRR